MLEPVKISVILPVYNPGHGIERCIMSLRHQTLHDIEMIFVDDCSTDSSMEKIRAAAAEDPRIRILTNPVNIGPGLSRNRGIEAVRGKYLSFVDPDDYVAEDFLELLYRKALTDELDIVKGSLVYEKEDGFKQKESNLNSHIRYNLRLGYPLYVLFSFQHQSAIYRRTMVWEKGVLYGEARKGQDTTFLLRVCSSAKTFDVENAANYYFRERTGSAMHTFNESYFSEELKTFREMMEYLSQHHRDDSFAVRYESFVGEDQEQ